MRERRERERDVKRDKWRSQEWLLLHIILQHVLQAFSAFPFTYLGFCVNYTRSFLYVAEGQ